MIKKKTPLMDKSWLLVKSWKIWQLPNVPTHYVINVVFCNKIVAFCKNSCISNKTATFCNKTPMPKN